MIKKYQPQTLGTHYKKAFKFRFYPEPEDIGALQQTFSCARFVYNKFFNNAKKNKGSNINIGLNIKSDITNSLQLTQYKNKSALGTEVYSYGEHVISESNLGCTL